jgi:hypothetical protein
MISSTFQIKKQVLGATVPGIRHYATATFWYLKALELYKTVKPYHINIPASSLPPGTQANEVSEPYHGIQVEDMRTREGNYTLDKNGFQYFRDGYRSNLLTGNGQQDSSLSSCIKYDEYEDPAVLRAKYRPAVEKFLLDKLGAEKVFAFAHEVGDAKA